MRRRKEKYKQLPVWEYGGLAEGLLSPLSDKAPNLQLGRQQKIPGLAVNMTCPKARIRSQDGSNWRVMSWISPSFR